MKKILILISAVVITLFALLWIVYQFGGLTKMMLSTLPLHEEDKLRKTYIASIASNYKPTDTVIVETAWSFCGNGAPGERPVIFSLNLSQTENKTLLQKQLGATLFNEVEAIQAYEDLFKKIGNYNGETYAAYFKNKKNLSIHAERTGLYNVVFYEYSEADGQSLSLIKEFEWENGKWVLIKTTEE